MVFKNTRTAQHHIEWPRYPGHNPRHTFGRISKLLSAFETPHARFCGLAAKINLALDRAAHRWAAQSMIPPRAAYRAAPKAADPYAGSALYILRGAGVWRPVAANGAFAPWCCARSRAPYLVQLSRCRVGKTGGS